MSFKINHVLAIISRNLLIIFKSPFEQINKLYWILLDILIFGFMTQNLYSKDPSVTNFSIILTNLTLWYIVARGTIGTVIPLNKDLSDLSFIGCIATPITTFEWIIALLTLGLIESLIGITTAIILTKIFFNFTIFYLGSILIPIIFSLQISAWIIGFITLSLFMVCGKKASAILFAIGWLFVPFCGIFYPTSALPKFLQKITPYIPMNHVFEGLRLFIKNGENISIALIKSFIFNLIYFAIAITIFLISFKYRKKIGLTRLETEA